MKPAFHASQNSARFIFADHAKELRRRSVEWFSARLAQLPAADRDLALENLLFEARHPLLATRDETEFSLSFQRTLRVPDDGREYPLPAGLGRLPFRAARQLQSAAVPDAWRNRSTGVVPLHPAEATWISFSASRPFAVQISAGGICAVSGLPGQERLVRAPQNYLSTPKQPWLDGFRVGPTTVRQFVAMPLGRGCTVEAQITGAEARGGLQIRVVPLKADILWKRHLLPACQLLWKQITAPHGTLTHLHEDSFCIIPRPSGDGGEDMGFGAGGRIRQKIYADPIDAGDWDEASALSCDVQLVSAGRWTELTGEPIPTEPPTPAHYAAAGIPWFDYATNASPITTPSAVAGISSVDTILKAQSGIHLPHNQSIPVPEPIVIG